MLSDANIAAATKQLIELEQSRKQGVQVSQRWPDMDIGDAYAISRAVAQHRISCGERLVGHKVGLTSKAMQASSRIDEPDFGHVFETMMISNGAKVARADYCVPRVEPELTFILSRPLMGPGLTLEQVLDATEWVVPSIEIIDARVQEPRKIFDTVADNGAAAGLVLGDQRFRPRDFDLRWVGALFIRNGEIEETGIAAGVMEHPANAVAWLGNKLASFGVGLPADHLVLSGSFTRPVWAAPGDQLVADFGPLGMVSVDFS